MFFERQQGRRCGLHAVHNLLRSADISSADMDAAAAWCAGSSEDVVRNHRSSAGDWSMDTLRRVLSERGYDVKRAVAVRTTGVRWDVAPMSELLEDENVVGFILQSKNHYACLRKEGAGWHFCDSLRPVPVPLEARVFCTECLYERCNAFLVRRHAPT